MKRKLAIIAVVIACVCVLFKVDMNSNKGIELLRMASATIVKATEDGVEYYTMWNDSIYERLVQIPFVETEHYPIEQWKYKIFIPGYITRDEEGKYNTFCNYASNVISVYDEYIEIDGVMYVNDPSYKLMEWLDWLYGYYAFDYEVYKIEE